MPAIRGHPLHHFRYRLILYVIIWLYSGWIAGPSLIYGSPAGESLSEVSPRTDDAGLVSERISNIRFQKHTQARKKIRNLSWSTKSLQATRKSAPDAPTRWDWTLRVRGKFKKKGRVLIPIQEDARIVWDPQPDPETFTLEVQPQSARTLIPLLAIDGLGNIEKQNLLFELPDFTLERIAKDPRTPPVSAITQKISIPRSTRKVASVPTAPPQVSIQEATRESPPTLESRLQLRGGLSLTALRHQEGVIDQSFTLPEYSTIAMTGKINLGYQLKPKKWEVATSIFGTLVNLKRATTDSLHYLGINGRIGYYFPEVAPQIRLGLHSGFYWTSAFASGVLSGFRGMAGPQIFPTLHYRPSAQELVSAYFKFSPVSNSLFGLLSIQNREIAAGMSYQEKTKSGYSVSGNLDVSVLQLRFNVGQIETQTLSLGVSFGL